KDTYEGNESDYRYNPLWKLPPTNSKSYRTFYKYADVQDKNAKWRHVQPMIRISEMYYIAAETATDKNTALGYLNTVRFHRGLNDLPNSADIDEELKKAYAKEFYGEG